MRETLRSEFPSNGSESGSLPRDHGVSPRQLGSPVSGGDRHTNNPADMMLTLAKIHAEPGEYWLAVQDGLEPWPALICDEYMVKDFFKRPWSTRKDTRKPDGTWGKLFKDRADLAHKRAFPAVLLALNKRYFSYGQSARLEFEMLMERF